MADQDLTIYNGMMMPKPIVGKLRAEQDRLEVVDSIYATPVINAYGLSTNFPAAADAYPTLKGNYIEALFESGNYDSSSKKVESIDSAVGSGSDSGSVVTSGLDCEGKDKDTQSCKDLAAGKAAREAAEKAAKEAAEKAAKEAAERAAKEKANASAPAAPAAPATTSKACDDKNLIARPGIDGILASDAKEDVKVPFRKNQWISKVTKSMYGIGDNAEESYKLYNAIAKMNGVPNSDVVPEGSTLNFPKVVKVGEKTYQLTDCSKSDENIQNDAEQNRTQIHSKFGGTVRPRSSHRKGAHGHNAPEAPAPEAPAPEAPAPAANAPAPEDKNDPARQTGVGRGQVSGSHARRNTSGSQSSSVFGDFWKGFKTGCLALPNAIQFLGNPSGNGAISTAIRDMTNEQVDKRLKDPGTYTIAAQGMSDAIARKPEVIAPAVDATAPTVISTYTKSSNLAKFKPAIKELLPMTLDELKTPENMAKMQPIVEAMSNDPKVLKVIAQIVNKSVKDNSGTITKDVLSGLLQSADNQGLLKKVFTGLAQQIVNDKNSPLIKQLADMAFSTMMTQLNSDPAKFEETQKFLDKSFASRGWAGSAMSRSKEEQEKAKKELQEIK